MIVSTVDSLGHCGGRGGDTASLYWSGYSTQGVIKLAGITVLYNYQLSASLWTLPGQES